MKKTTRKLVLRKVTVRELSGQALTHVIGGQETDAANNYPESGYKQCGSGLIVDYPQSGYKQCGSGLIVALNGVARDRGLD